MKKVLALLISVALIIGCIPVFSVGAQETETEEREVYYSDLFYGYSYYLTNSTVFTSYYENNYDMFCDIYKTFYHSDAYKWAAFRELINTATSFKDLAKKITDMTGSTDFTYEAMLDSANVRFAAQIMNNFDDAEEPGNVARISDIIKGVCGAVDEYASLNEGANKSDTETVKGIFEVVKNKGYFAYITSTELNKFLTFVSENRSNITSLLEAGATIADMMKVYSTAIALESLRIELVATAGMVATDTVTKDGMNRLYSQLQSNCFDYFWDNYIKEGLISAVEKGVAEFIKKQIANPDVSLTIAALAVLNVASKIVFDVIFDIPTIDDLTTQIILSEYVKDFYTLVKARAGTFSSPFSSREIAVYEKAFTVFVAAVNAAMDASGRIVTDSNSGRLSTAKNTYYGKDMYSIVINQGLHTLRITPEEQLVKTHYGNWDASAPTLRGGSNKPTDSSAIYCPWSGLNVNLRHPLTGTLTVPAGEEVIINGNFTIGNTYSSPFTPTRAEVYGKLTVNGKFTVTGYKPIKRTQFTNYGEIVVNGDIEIGYDANVGTSGVWYLSGHATDLNTENSYSCTNLGNLVLTGNALQTFTRVFAKNVTILNESVEGVNFTYWNSDFSGLFNHNGNVVSYPSTAKFGDYDGDGKNDNVDDYPLIGNDCKIIVQSNENAFGTVSHSVIDTIGGTKHTVTATPHFKYRLANWVNASGTAVSSNETYTFVARGDDTLTAVFEKRKQPITVSSQGGKINAPEQAEIESTVSVTVTEDEGYIYKEGSLSYNGIALENGSFVMPDEPVILTAQFLYNDYYLPLKQKIADAEGHTFEEYSAESFSALENAVANAKQALNNHVSKEISDSHIAQLDAAISGLSPKFITSIDITSIPTVYKGVEGMIDPLEVTVIYDNGTTLVTEDYALSGFDINTVGEQNITVTHGEFSDSDTITVCFRSLSDVTFAAIPDQLYLGENTVYEPKLSAAYNLNGDVLEEGRDYTVTFTDNTYTGTATATVSGIGDYEGDITLSFIIYCEHNYEVTEYTAPTCTEDGYRKEICSVCKKVKECFYKKKFTESLPESKHSYGMGVYENYYYTAVGAEKLELQFNGSTYFGRNDYLYIYTEAGTLIGQYGSNTLSNATITVPGQNVRLRLSSGYDLFYGYGFKLISVTAYYPYPELAALGHTEGEWITESEPTVFEEGVKRRYCTVCDDCIGEEVLEKLTFWGDADKSGALDSCDLAVIRKATLFPDTEYMKESDANADGVVDIKDLIRLKRYLAGQDVKLG